MVACTLRQRIMKIYGMFEFNSEIMFNSEKVGE